MLLLSSLIAALVINFVLFLIAYTRQSDKLTDMAYALSFLSIVIIAVILSSPRTSLLLILAAMVVLWAVRLGGFLVIRIWNNGKDGRFDSIRNNFVRFGKFWLGQGVAAWILLLPLLFVATAKGKFSVLSVIGVVIWAGGLAIETLSDAQKYQFKQNAHNKNKWIATGLWRYSRHPNYFGEICVWIGLYVTAFSALTGVERVIGLISPVAIFIVLRYVSGVPPLEKSAQERWGNNPDYQSYALSTNLLVLGRRKK